MGASRGAIGDAISHSKQVPGLYLQVSVYSGNRDSIRNDIKGQHPPFSHTSQDLLAVVEHGLGDRPAVHVRGVERIEESEPFQIGIPHCNGKAQVTASQELQWSYKCGGRLGLD